jgi:hypothetical protein
MIALAATNSCFILFQVGTEKAWPLFPSQKPPIFPRHRLNENFPFTAEIWYNEPKYFNESEKVSGAFSFFRKGSGIFREKWPRFIR